MPYALPEKQREYQRRWAAAKAAAKPKDLRKGIITWEELTRIEKYDSINYSKKNTRQTGRRTKKVSARNYRGNIKYFMSDFLAIIILGILFIIFITDAISRSPRMADSVSEEIFNEESDF